MALQNWCLVCAVWLREDVVTVAGFLSGARAPSDQGSTADGLEPRPTGSDTTAPTRLTFTHIVKIMYALTLILYIYIYIFLFFFTPFYSKLLNTLTPRKHPHAPH